MLEWIQHFLEGWIEISVDPVSRSQLAAMLWEAGIPFWHEKRKGNILSVRIAAAYLNMFSWAAEQNCLDFHVRRKGGMAAISDFCRSRPGIPVGIVLLLVWCLYSQNLVWDITIDGCEQIPEETVKEILTEEGCGVGDNYKTIDFDALHATIKAKHPEIAWISVYMHGTTAEVQLRETKFPADSTHPAGIYANIKAAEAGEIVSVDVFEGQTVVQAGDVVMPGDLLISGVVMMKKENQSRLEYAEGEVYAKVAVPITVEVSLSKSENIATGREKAEKSIKIFKKSINLFRNTGIPYTTYDTIDMMEEVCFFGRWTVPVTIYSTVYRELETREVLQTPEEAASEAMKKLRAEMDKAIGTGEMLSRTVTTAIAEDGTYCIECLLYVLRNIAVTEEFSVTDSADAPSA